jgi:hypothetical protein
MIDQQTPGIIRDASLVNRQLPSAYAQCAGENCDHLHSNGRVLHCAPIISAAARIFAGMSFPLTDSRKDCTDHRQTASAPMSDAASAAVAARAPRAAMTLRRQAQR